MNSKGFTLMELMVVVLIVGILATVAVPSYKKTRESSHAAEAITVLQQLSMAQRQLSRENLALINTGSGAMTNSVNTGTCPSAGKPANEAELIACNYLAKNTWEGGDYKFYLGARNCTSKCGSITPVACAERDSSAESPYSEWKYCADSVGTCYAFGTGVYMGSCK